MARRRWFCENYNPGEGRRCNLLNDADCIGCGEWSDISRGTCTGALLECQDAVDELKKAVTKELEPIFLPILKRLNKILGG